ncbi:disease resistance protein RGA3 isoform X2 [Populus alba x Populus x berolinensis]|nr:disease resistance protein RGA3 isoform X2 [Populus alba x Populus x berolinensis]
MAAALLSPILEQLTRIAAQEVREEVSLVGDVKKQVDKLKSNLLSIQSVLEDADRKQVKEKAVRDWVDKLKDVCYDMDDVLDEWSTAIVRWKMEEAEENTRSLQKMRCFFLKSPCFCLNQVVRRRDIALKIKEVCEKVDEIAKARDMYGFALYRATDELQRLTTTSFVDESSVIGRDGEKRNVVSKLLAESSQEAQDVDVISVVGLGGIGKTTLAQLAFNDSEVTAHFEKKIWVCISEPFDEVRIAKAILEQLEGRPTNLVELQSLLQGVSESITGKRLLLVLDDVWTENHGQWEKLKPSLTGCARGSRILVTTRKDAVATMIGTDHRINIEKLSDEICSPTGKLVQIEHALTAVGSGQTSLGIKAANGVVIATEKKLPSILVDESSVQKIQNLTPNIGVVYSGMGPDFRVLVRKSRKQAEQYHRLYKEPIPVTQLVRETAAMQEFTQSGGVRPFGVSLLVAGFDDKGPQLYQVDPSGSYFSWKASAMGKNVSNAKTFLEKRYTDDMELDDAVHTAILTLKEGFEGQISGKNIEIGIIGADKQFRHALS